MAKITTIDSVTLDEQLGPGPDRSAATPDRSSWRGFHPPTLCGSPQAVPLRSGRRHNRMSKSAD
ncbi:hypothetical protein RBSH_01366 [Rhodopirellula baltica SH28]|uniref:Uncharacterized protein n=1 Tax=Rhodopirellula baltica SH28 TaxID=993517 RepID=K5DLJ3_RHOBT|nr:hypothetical protein RBSH_01366 [Rhodopirellula baltica SH28]